MNRIMFRCIFFLLISVNIFSQVTPTLYDNVSPSIVYLEHGIYMDPKLCNNIEVFRKFERETESNILSSYLPLSSGTGFIIDQSGLILTNNHVVQIDDLWELREKITDYLLDLFDHSDFQNIRSTERTMIKSDLKSMILAGKYQFTASIDDEVFDLDILLGAKKDDPDIALVKLKSLKSWDSIKLLETNHFNSQLIGTEVYSFGFPLGMTMDSFFDDRVVTMNKGNISALRDAELGIQHSAAISQGNSGGPLITEDGNVVGINTASINAQIGNSLFYAIGVDEIEQFLSKYNYSDVLKWNKRISSGNSSVSVKTNILGEFESSADLIVDVETDTQVFIDGEYIGHGPQFISLDSNLSELKALNDNGEFSIMVRKLSSIQGSTTITPEIKLKPSIVSFLSNENDIKVFLDGRMVGETPFKTELFPGEYKISYSKEGFYFDEHNIEVLKNSDREVQIHGEPVYKVTLTGLSEKYFDEKRYNLKLYMASSSKVFEMPIQETFELPEGNWDLEITGHEEIDGIQVAFAVDHSALSDGVLLDISDYLPTAELTLSNLPLEGMLWVDEKLFPYPSSKKLELPLGEHSIYIWKDGYQPLDTEVYISPENDASIQWQELPSYRVKARTLTISEIVVGVLGAAALGIGAYINQDSFAIANSSNYEEYRNIKIGSYVSGLSGIGLIGSGIVMHFIASHQRKLYRQQEAKMMSLEDNSGRN